MSVLAHEMSAAAGWDLSGATLVPVALPALLYLTGRLRLHRRGTVWPVSRDLAFATGLLCIVAAVMSPLATYDERFPVHVVQHLLLGMAAPLAFALSAPITLLLRAGDVRIRRRAVAVLHTRLVRWISWAPVGVVLSVGLMWPLYLTPLYAETLHRPVLHALVHMHMLAAGALLAFALVGLDPIPGRGSFRVRVGATFTALAAHGILAKYLYIHASTLAARPDVGTANDWHNGAQILWYGGDALDALLIVAFFAQWYRAGGRELRREQRRHTTASAHSRPQISR